ncbi:MAG TPA: flagellar M-ring protein FliF C-terminal domain-containing protein, partial [Candidatus Hydrogenedentes bacterium]|nr:flagellar M-ring protein FliF C-terminal domain-containing protein [Candidatus Hydrogenedentota bacterium]
LPPENEYAALASSKLEYVAELEKQREAKLRDKLREMGVRGTVSVSAVVDFDQKEMTDAQITAGTELSTYTTETSSTGSDVLPQGTPGATANLPESAASGGTSSNEKTSEEIINYEPSRRTTRTKTDPGDVVKYIVTLVVEGEYKQSQAADGSTTREYAGLSESRKQLFIDLAKAAVGEGRSPTEVQLYDQPFDIEGLTPEGSATAVASGLSETITSWAWPAAQILLILGAFMLVRRALARAVYVAKPVEEEEELPVELPEATREDLRRQEVEQEIIRLSQEQPEMVAALIRNWLAEEEE